MLYLTNYKFFGPVLLGEVGGVYARKSENITKIYGGVDDRDSADGGVLLYGGLP